MNDDSIVDPTQWFKSEVGDPVYRMDLSAKIAFIKDQFQEVAFGYNDSGCFWTIHYGPRGAGCMIEGIGKTFSANCDTDDLEELVDMFMKHLESQ